MMQATKHTLSDMLRTCLTKYLRIIVQETTISAIISKWQKTAKDYTEAYSSSIVTVLRCLGSRYQNDPKSAEMALLQ
jgi:hypothetical protein